jgi:hypothetical protein
MPLSGLAGSFSISSKHRAAFDRHFDHFIPDEVIRGDRDIVLIDTYESGGTLVAMRKMVGQYVNQRREKLGLAPLAVKLVGLAIDPGWKQRDDVDIVVGEKFGNPIRYQYEVAYHDQQVRLLEGKVDYKKLRPNPKHMVFRRELFKRMRRDRKLDSVLRDEFADITR